MIEFEKRSYYTPTEFGAIFHVHPATVMNWIHAGTLYAVKLGERTYRIPLAVVMQRANPQAGPTRIEIDASAELQADERRRPRRVIQRR
jgi:excisionase family DNA binding protein